MFEDFEKALEELKNDIPQPLGKKIGTKAAPKFVEKVKKIFEESIAEYYAARSSGYYTRTYSLIEAYKVTCRGNTINLKSNASMVPDTHRVAPEYIYDYMFFEGYHGGANKGPNHPSPGTLLYRSPVPGFGKPPYTRWSDPAEQTEAPAKMVETRFNALFNGPEADEIIYDAMVSVLKTYRIFSYL